jgi:hypothetical protein
VLLSVAIVCVCALPARAIDPGQETTGAFADPASSWFGMNWDSVGLVRGSGGEVRGSCVAISDQYFLTADHMNVQVGSYTIECDGILYEVLQATSGANLFGADVPPDFELIKVRRVTAQADGPIIPTHSSLYDEELAMGQELILSGYGASGTDPFGVKRWGTNRQASTTSDAILLASYDVATEYEAVGDEMDSGGGIFARSANGQWEYTGTFTFSGSGPSLAAYSERIIESTFAGDLDSDGDMDTDDLQSLHTAISAGSGSPTYDMNGDGGIDAEDLDYFIANSLQWHNGVEGGYGTRRGDFNLDGQVNGVDLSIMRGSFGSTGTWLTGDANFDGQVTGTDLSALAAGFRFPDQQADSNFLRVSHWLPAGGMGDWDDSANWSRALDSNVVEIGNGSTARIDGPAQLDGKLIVGGYRGEAGTLLIDSGADLTVDALEVGRFASGSIEQRGGTFLAIRAEVLNGTIELSGGAMTIGDLVAGDGALIHQAGGTAELGTGRLRSGGEYRLEGGGLSTTSTLTVADGGMFRWLGGALAANDLIIENGGDLLIGFDADAAAIADGTLFGGALSGLGQADLCVGNAATLTHLSGTLSSGGLHVGYEAGDTGTYELGGSGVLSPTCLSVGTEGEGTLLQTGGTASPGTLVIGYYEGGEGVYRLTDGLVDTGFVFVGTNPYWQSGQGSPAGAGVLEWFGGTLSVGSYLALREQGTLAMGFDFAMDDLVVSRSLIDGGQLLGLDLATLKITNGASATHDAFSTTVGTLEVSGAGLSVYTMTAGADLTADRVVIASGQGEVGIVDMAAGSTLTVTGSVDVGEQDPAGGITSAQGGLRMTGGTLSAATLSLGRSTAPTTGVGRLIVLGGADIIVHETLHVGAAGDIFAPGGLQITMDSADLENESSTSRLSLAASFNKLTLQFEGNPVAYNTLEIACGDYGLSEDGFAGNFALEELLIGSASSLGMAQLVDLFDNAPTDDILYVDTLHIFDGSSFDLNGLTVYYHTLIVDGSGLLTDSTRPSQPQLWDIYQVIPIAATIPEPATMSLLMLSGLALLKRRRGC